MLPTGQGPVFAFRGVAAHLPEVRAFREVLPGRAGGGSIPSTLSGMSATSWAVTVCVVWTCSAKWRTLTVIRNSPLRLSETGHKVSDDLDLPRMAKMIAVSAKPKVKGKLPYDIQGLCFDYIREKYKLSMIDEPG